MLELLSVSVEKKKIELKEEKGKKPYLTGELSGKTQTEEKRVSRQRNSYSNPGDKSLILIAFRFCLLADRLMCCTIYIWKMLVRQTSV